MKSEVFIYVTGIATLLGLILQIRDSFPQHRNIRNAVFFLVLGIFVGSLLTTFRSVSVNVDFKITPYVVLIGLAILALVVVLVLAALIVQELFCKKVLNLSDMRLHFGQS